MTWNLFIDDERFPVDEPGMFWEIARNYSEVVKLIEEKGMPSYISFDHDLGDFENGDGYKIAKYLVDLDIYTNYNFPKDFSFYVHSQNPVGKANIEGLLNGYLKARSRAEEIPCNERRAGDLYKAMLDDVEGDITVGKLKG